MRPPSLLLDESTRRLGCWESGTRTLRISEKLIRDRPWQVVIEVLIAEVRLNKGMSLGVQAVAATNLSGVPQPPPLAPAPARARSRTWTEG